MKMTKYLIVLAFIACGFSAAAQSSITDDDRKSLEKATVAIRDAFARGDVPAIVALHHPDVVKYFGGNNVVNGRTALEKGLTEMFRTSKMEFIDHKLESLIFIGETAVETSVFTIRVTPKTGGKSSISRGRAMVVYVRYKDSPTGWASIREMAQAPPDEK